MSDKYYDIQRGEIVSHGKYFEIVSFKHDNHIYDTYQDAKKALDAGIYKDDSSAFITTRYY